MFPNVNDLTCEGLPYFHIVASDMNSSYLTGHIHGGLSLCDGELRLGCGKGDSQKQPLARASTPNLAN